MLVFFQKKNPHEKHRRAKIVSNISIWKSWNDIPLTIKATWWDIFRWNSEGASSPLGTLEWERVPGGNKMREQVLHGNEARGPDPHGSEPRERVPSLERTDRELYRRGREGLLVRSSCRAWRWCVLKRELNNGDTPTVNLWPLHVGYSNSPIPPSPCQCRSSRSSSRSSSRRSRCRLLPRSFAWLLWSCALMVEIRSAMVELRNCFIV